MRISGLFALAAFAGAPAVAVAQPDTLSQLLTTPPTTTIDVATLPEMPPIRVQPSATPLDFSQYSPEAVRLARVGRYLGLPPPLNTPPRRPPFERPWIRPMINMYQLDRRYADLFSVQGKSMICGAASMANAIVYLRINRRPALVELAKASLPRTVVESRAAAKEHIVRVVFARCDVSRRSGSTDRKLLGCARRFLTEGGYASDWTSLRSTWAAVGARDRVAPQPIDLVSAVRSNRAAVLLFGWYTATLDPVTHAWTYTRGGGHFVTLAGYDQADRARIYISNPLVNYARLGPWRTSAVVLEPVEPGVVFAPIDKARADDLNTASGQKWQTRDLAAHRIGVLESMVVIGPPRVRKAVIARS